MSGAGIAVGAFCATALVVCAAIAVRRSLAFRMAYWLYTNTRLGLAMHRRACSRTGALSRHSATQTLQFGNILVRGIPMLDDNYAWVVADAASGRCALVDPCHAAAATSCMEQLQEELRSAGSTVLHLDTVLCTHKHWDHAGGNADLRSSDPALAILGPVGTPGITRVVSNGERITIGGLECHVIATPGHTSVRCCRFAGSPGECRPRSVPPAQHFTDSMPQEHIVFYFPPSPSAHEADGTGVLLSGDARM